MKTKFEVYTHSSKTGLYEIYYLEDGSESECFMVHDDGSIDSHEIYSYATDTWIQTDIETDLKMYDIKRMALAVKFCKAIDEYKLDLKENGLADEEK